jgi:hypothetical protein
MRPAHTGQGIIKEGKLDAGAAAGWRMDKPSIGRHCNMTDL